MKHAIIKHVGNPNTTLYASFWLNAQGKRIALPMGLDSKAAAKKIVARHSARVVEMTDEEFVKYSQPSREY